VGEVVPLYQAVPDS